MCIKLPVVNEMLPNTVNIPRVHALIQGNAKKLSSCKRTLVSSCVIFIGRGPSNFLFHTLRDSFLDFFRLLAARWPDYCSAISQLSPCYKNTECLKSALIYAYWGISTNFWKWCWTFRKSDGILCRALVGIFARTCWTAVLGRSEIHVLF